MGLEAPGVLDALVHDHAANRILLLAYERRPWDGGDLQLWQLQEKLNAYASYALDGEFHDDFPELAHLPICIQLRSLHNPSPRALELLAAARRQLELAGISLEVWHIGENESSPV